MPLSLVTITSVWSSSPALSSSSSISPSCRSNHSISDAVVQQVAANLGSVRQKRRHAHIGEFLSAPQTDARFESTMWLMGAVPEAKRPIRGSFVQKTLEIARVVIVRDSIRHVAFDSRPFELRAGRISPTAARFPIPRSPAFAGVSDEIALLFQQIGKTSRNLDGKFTAMRPGVFESPRIPGPSRTTPGWGCNPATARTRP